MKKNKIIRISTETYSLDLLLRGQLRFMQQFYDVVAIASDKESLEKVRRRENVRTYCVKMTRKITPFKDLIALYKLYVILMKERPLIVHTHSPKAGLLGMAAAWLARVPNRLHTVAGLPLLEAQGAKRILLNIVEKITYLLTTNVYPNSWELKKIIENEKFCPPTKLKVFANGSSNGINTNYYNPKLFTEHQKEAFRKRLAIKKEDFVYLFVGRLVPDKGIRELIYAFNDISSKNKNVKLLLVGAQEVNLNPLSQKTLEIIKNNAQIINLGFQSDVRPFFAISDLLTFPSYREGMPNAVLQACSMEVPAIVTDINGCNEIIKDRINGIIIPPKNTIALKMAMLDLLDDRSVLCSFKKYTRKITQIRYEQKIVWNALLNEYRELEDKHLSLDTNWVYRS